MEEKNKNGLNLSSKKNAEQILNVASDPNLLEPKNNHSLIIAVVILVLLVISGGIFWRYQKNNLGNKLQGNLVQLIKNEPVEPKWLTYVSDDKHFKIDYLSNWKILDDKNLYFGVALYNDAQESEASIKIKRIEAKDKVELQKVLNNERQDCLKVEDEKNCPKVVDVDKLTKIKISGEISRIDTESEYLSGTTIYIYMQDYYLAVYEEYNNYDLLPTFEKIVNSIYIDMEPEFKHYYCNRKPGQVSSMYGFSAYCYTVESGDTLWSIAEKYYGDGKLWTNLKTFDDKDVWDIFPPNPNDPRALIPGTKLILWHSLQFANDKLTSGGVSNGFGLDIDNGDLYSTRDGKIFVGKKVYDGPFSGVQNFFVDEKTNNKVYIISVAAFSKRAFQFVVNKERNPYVGEGFEFELLTFNHNEDLYAVRTNVRQDVPNPGFMVLSNIGNGPEYDYVDSLIWYDNDTLVYRAQNDNKWRVVINHKDYEVYDYLENLRVEDNNIKFDARHDDGSWTKEEILLDDDEYNTSQKLFPESNNSKLEQESFLNAIRNSRTDLSEEQILEIEKTRHHKTLSLVDNFGKEITVPLEVYLDPVDGTGISPEVGRLTFKTKDGVFKFADGKFDLFVDELGAYTLSLQQGWSSESLKEINPIDFRYNANEFKILVNNEKYDQDVKKRYIKVAEEGDTLWTVAEKYYGEGYYWPLIAKNSNFNFQDDMPKISTGDELYVFPFSSFNRDQLYELKKKFHEKNTEQIFTINNKDFSYSIDYPACWKLGVAETNEYSENSPYYDSYIYRQAIMGPIPAENPRGQRRPVVDIYIYDNRAGMDLKKFVIYKHITDQWAIDDGTFITETRADGGVLASFYGEVKHLIFFKGNLIYDVTSTNHHSVDDISKREMSDIISSFKFIDL